MKHILASTLVIASLLAASSARAHFIWAIVDPGGKQLRMECAESPGVEQASLLGGLIPSTKTYGIGDLVDERDHLHVVAPFKPGAQVGGVDLIYGLKDKTLVHWSAKGASSLKAAGRSLGLSSEILLHVTKAGFSAILQKAGKRVAGVEVEIYTPGSKDAIKVKTGADGSFSVPSVKSGVLAMGAIIREPISGEFKGRHYVETASLCSLTVRLG